MTKEEDFKLLANILSNYYFEPEVEIKTFPPEVVKKKRLKVIETPHSETKKIDNGPQPIGNYVLVASTILGLLSLLVNNILAISIITIGAVTGFILRQRMRDIEFKTTTRTEKKEIEEEYEETIQKPPQKIVIDNDEEILKIERRYIPFESIEINGNEIFMGEPELSKKVIVKYPMLENFELINEKYVETNEMLEKIPYVLEGDRDSYPINDTSSFGEEVELVGFEKKLVDNFKIIETEFQKDYLKEFKIYLNEIEKVKPNLIKINTNISDTEAKDLKDTIIGPYGHEFEDKSKNWIREWDKNNMAINYVRFNSLSNELGPINFNLEKSISYSAFNFYCPKCNQEKTDDLLSRNYDVHESKTPDVVYFSKNSRCFYDPETELWECPTCGETTKKPIPIHKNYDEILLPAASKMMFENKNQRIKEYNRIRGEETKLINEMEMEIEKLSFTNLTDLYKLTDEVEKMKANILGENEAIKLLSETQEKYLHIQNTVIQNILNFSKNIEENIQKNIDKVLGEVDGIKNKEMTLLNEEMSVFARAKKEAEDIRDETQRQTFLAMKQNTQVVSEGINAINSQLSNVNSNLETNNQLTTEGNQLSREQTTSIKKGFSEQKVATNQMTQQQKKSNAIQAARAKKEGIDLHDEAFWRLDKKIPKGLAEVGGFFSGSSTMEIEGEKLNG